MSYVIDRRLNGKNKSTVNRQRFLRRYKAHIKKAVEELYNVRVEGVATQNCKGRVRRTRFGYVQEPVHKKATVKLHPDDVIEMF